ncbi:MAG: tRNA lysidine(34) synthetase TilS [Isosphaeraceae bacterium]|nr:tRNA lysidine(34) synthetase TilS [Isosphaeraceae bacterium]
MPAPWVERISGQLRRWRDAGTGSRWVVAVSGGSDSVGLLRVLHGLVPELGLDLSVAHLDHGARGEAARSDAEFVADVAGSLNLPFDLGRWSSSRSAHFESDARRARYAWLTEVAERRGATAVAVGHTRDDQAETILHRILRGTGLRGLAGVPRRRRLGAGVTLVRPLLDVSRAEIRSYLAALGQPFHEDATNADPSRTRARLRHDLLPRLEADYNPKVVEALIRLGALSGAADRARRQACGARLRAPARELGPQRITLYRPPLARANAFERAEVVRLAWRCAGWPEGAMRAEHWERIAGLLRTRSGRVTVAGGVEAAAQGDVLVLDRPSWSKPATSFPAPSLPLPLPGEAGWAGGRILATLEPDEARDESVDVDALVLPLFIRAPRPGDRFDPLGMAGNTTPLSDFLRGRRITRERRTSVPVVCDQKGIVWVAGHRIAHRVRLRDDTTRTAGLRWVEGDNEVIV